MSEREPTDGLYGQAFKGGPHLAFGKGSHVFLVAPLARLEARVALSALLARLRGLRLDVPESELRYRFLPGFRALEPLPVRWDTAS